MIVSCDSFAIWPPFAIRVSVAITPGPPAFVIIASLFPCGLSYIESDCAMLNNSPIVSTRIIPALLNAALKTASLPAKLPV